MLYASPEIVQIKRTRVRDFRRFEIAVVFCGKLLKNLDVPCSNNILQAVRTWTQDGRRWMDMFNDKDGRRWIFTNNDQ
jgi:hypothetical protein